MRPASLLACIPGLAPHCLLQNLEKSPGICGVTEQDNMPPPLPPIEIFPSDDAKSKPFVADSINIQGGLTLLKERYVKVANKKRKDLAFQVGDLVLLKFDKKRLQNRDGHHKGRVNSADVLGVGNTDLVPGKYEGGLKLWECAIDLVNTLRREIQDGRLSFRGKRVLELGCGHGLPGVFACLKGASTVHFQDFNAEVLRSLTIPNVNANLEQARSRQARLSDAGQTPTKSNQLSPEVHFYAGDWADLDEILSVVGPDQHELLNENESRELNLSFREGDLMHDSTSQDHSDKSSSDYSHQGPIKRSRKLSGSRACERGIDSDALEGGYDIILMSETVYSPISLPKLYALIRKCLRPRYGVVYVAGKKHYFGVGGGTRQFKSLVEEDGVLGAHLVADFADGSSNVREIWKFFFK